jgi:transcriptional regulator with XRE-family HTH domain
VKPLARAFGAVLREARHARGLSQEQVAEFAEFDRTYPSLLERGLREPGLSAFVRLCVAVERSPHEILDLTLGLAGGTPAAGTSPKLPRAGPAVQPAPAGPAEGSGPDRVAIQPVRTRLRGDRRSRLRGLQSAQQPLRRDAVTQSPPLPGHAVAQRPPEHCPEEVPAARHAVTQSPPRRDTE